MQTSGSLFLNFPPINGSAEVLRYWIQMSDCFLKLLSGDENSISVVKLGRCQIWRTGMTRVMPPSEINAWVSGLDVCLITAEV